MSYLVVFDNCEVWNIFLVCFFFINRFLFVRYKVVIELYNEVIKFSERDWVFNDIDYIFIYILN